MTREQHLAWCKQRALEYVDAGDLAQAVASMDSDLRKHPETDFMLSPLVGVGLLYVANKDAAGVRYWINGFT